jgi:LAGLIDADG endonuclease
VGSDNPSGADNQQERPGFAEWIVGFVDGEGCFSVPIFKNRKASLGWQAQPTFAVVQGERSIGALHLLERYFECGQVGRHARHDNHREPLCRYTVRRLTDLSKVIIPFFEEHPLVTAKANDFRSFAVIVRMMEAGLHLSVDGMSQIANMTQAMNRRQPSRYLESSEATRRPSRVDIETKIWS